MKRSLSAIHQRGEGERAIAGAFTLIELLVVIAIIGILVGIALPRLQGFGKSNAGVAATRQLLDDVSLARASAIGSRSQVYMVFVPPEITNWILDPLFVTARYTNVEQLIYSNLVAEQFTAYAIYSDRNVGDQPGQKHPRYLTEWRTLPAGMFIPLYKFQYGNTNPINYSNGVAPFATNSFPFPMAVSSNANLPYIAFDYQGRLVSQHDEVLPLARGSIFYPRDVNANIAPPFIANLVENPPNNSITQSNHVHIDWLTGRGHVERSQLQ